MKSTLFSITILALLFVSAVHAQITLLHSPAARQASIDAAQRYVVDSPDATVTCSFTFTANRGNKFIKYCVTKNGNITQFQTPEGNEYIALAPAGEGYGLCNFDTATQYFDYA